MLFDEVHIPSVSEREACRKMAACHKYHLFVGSIGVKDFELLCNIIIISTIVINDESFMFLGKVTKL